MLRRIFSYWVVYRDPQPVTLKRRCADTSSHDYYKQEQEQEPGLVKYTAPPNTRLSQTRSKLSAKSYLYVQWSLRYQELF